MTTTIPVTEANMIMMQVRWRHHHSGLMSYLRQMLVSELFVDVTLCCQGKRLRAHRVLLSASSPYLQALLLAHPSSEHTTIILHDIPYEDMRSLLDFIYTGVVTLPEERLTSFLAAAEALNITVLTDKQLYRTLPVDDWSLNASPTPYKTVPPLIKVDRHRHWNKSNNDIDTSIKHQNDMNDIKYHIPDYLQNNNLNDMKPFFDIKMAFDSSRCSSFSDSSEDSQRRSIDSGLEVLNSPSYCCYDNKDGIKTKQEDSKCFYPSSGSLDINNLNMITNSAKDDKRYLHTVDVVESQWLRPLPSLMPIVPPTSLPMNSPPILSPYHHHHHHHHRITKYIRHSLGGIVTPSPWSQSGRPPVGPPRKPSPNKDQVKPSEVPSGVPESKPSIENEEAKDLSKTDTSHAREALELSTKKHLKTEIEDVNKQLKIHEKKSSEIVKLCKLKERRLQEFYREQRQSELGLAEASVSLKSEEQLAPSINFQYKNNSGSSNNINSNNKNETKTVAPFINNLTKVDDNWNCEKQDNANSSLFCNNQSLDLKNNSLTPGPSLQKLKQESSTSLTTNDSNNNHRLAEDRSLLSSSRFGCNDCNFESANKQELTEHVKVHIDKGSLTFPCSICSKSFFHKGQLMTHQKLHHEAKNAEHSCSHCGKAFLTKASLKVHLRTHTGEKPFHCNECGKQFSQLRNYKYHRSVHEGTKEFAATCPECGKYFNDRGYLSSHMKIHRNRKEYGCEYCGKCFNQRVAYNMHVRIHTGLKPHVCPHCSKSFSRKMLLKQHLRIHTGEKPFSCIVCQKAFADRSNMTLHMRLHSGIKPYTCNVCSKSFTKKHHLKTHMNYHTGVKPYACSKCGLKFSQSSNMRTHFKKCSSMPTSSTSSALQIDNNSQNSFILSENNNSSDQISCNTFSNL